MEAVATDFGSQGGCLPPGESLLAVRTLRTGLLGDGREFQASPAIRAVTANHCLVPRLRAAHRAASSLPGLLPDVPLRTDDRCLSPSDFGFHNAILANDGRLRFIDFEYAGWDDPSKLICDFFCQPAVPAPPQAFERFARAVVAEFPNPAIHLARARLLLPIYRVKWVCIMLNEFLPVGGSRRAFSGTSVERDARKISQLAKAQAALAFVLGGTGIPACASTPPQAGMPVPPGQVTRKVA